MDWRLIVFRSGLLACAVLALVAATQFDIGASAIAVWSHNPTTDEIVGANLAATRYQDDCLASKARTTEYPSGCYPDAPILRGLPREKALENIQRFVITITALLAAMLLVGLVGFRMVRKN